MARTVSIGKQDYASLREHQYFYIDKTDFIREWWENGDDTTLITRPRRFGKTLNMSMLECFFSINYAGRKDLFQDLAIWRDEKYRRIQGTFPVIFLSFADVKAADYPNARRSLAQNLADMYRANDFLLREGLLNEREKEQYLSISSDMEDSVLAHAIRAMAGYLSRYYQKKVIILLDEYDTPMHEAYLGGYWNEIVMLIRSLLNATFKTNPWLERGLMTGITRISKESVFSDLNHLKVITTTSEDYAAAFGFTEQEVMQALLEYGMEKSMPEVKAWYDGFVFGNYSDIYNPWSITNFLDEKRIRAYWSNSSENGLVSKLIREGEPQVKQTFELLLDGKSFRTRMDEQVIFSRLDGNTEALWSLLVASGYFKVITYEMDTDRGEEIYELALTNREVLIAFRQMVRDWFQRAAGDYNDFVKALLLCDLKAMNHYINRVAMATFSYFDTGKGVAQSADPERFYHGFVLGLLVDLEDRYHLRSNRESGFGRYDVVLEPKNPGDTAYVLEFKAMDSTEEASLEDAVKAAKKQITEKQYDSDLLSRGIEPGRIQHYGIAFSGKKVLIG